MWMWAAYAIFPFARTVLALEPNARHVVLFSHRALNAHENAFIHHLHRNNSTFLSISCESSLPTQRQIHEINDRTQNQVIQQKAIDKRRRHWYIMLLLRWIKVFIKRMRKRQMKKKKFILKWVCDISCVTRQKHIYNFCHRVKMLKATHKAKTKAIKINKLMMIFELLFRFSCARLG